LPAQSEVQRQLRFDLEIVLDVRPDQVLPVMPLESGAQLRELEVTRPSIEEIFDAGETQPAAASAVGKSVVAEVFGVDAALEVIAPAAPENVFGELVQIL